jgi:biopolymer transport protein ExbD
MAGIDAAGGHTSRRAVNHDIPLIPFIDFLLCLVSFLLITAVWSQMARIETDARVPGPAGAVEPKKTRQLHVEMKGERRFQLVWKEGSQVLDSIDVPRVPETLGDGEVTYPELARKIDEVWQRFEGRHFAPDDTQRDQAILHTDDSTPFSDVVRVIDAVQTPHRPLRAGDGQTRHIPAFNVAFAVN